MASPALLATLSRATLLQDLPDAVLEALGDRAHQRRFQAGEVIFHQGDPGDTLYILQTGRVKVTVLGREGEEAVLRVFGPGDCFGELALIDGAPRSATIETLEPATAVVLRRADFLELLRLHPEANERLLITLTGKLRRLTDDFADLAFLGLEERLAKKLLELAEQYGRQRGTLLQIELPINQEELAAMIGSTRSSVNRALGWLEDEGSIRRVGRRIAITDESRLRSLAL
jgi:CRP/FNR family transcriptional regulator, cyclic AMP receptor protein